MIEINTPKNNVYAYEIINNIETGLRELIIHYLTGIDGQKWYKRRLPSDILLKYKTSIDIEKQIKWTSLIPHHPIYYIDFSDLRKIIEKSDNWNDCFKNIFLRKENIINSLSDIEMIRNRVAHNRLISDEDIILIEASYYKIVNAVGKLNFDEFVKRNTVIYDIKQVFLNLSKECDTSFISIKQVDKIGTIQEWNSIKYCWWFDDLYIGYDLTSIEIYFNLVEDYINLPRRRGNGHILESWVKDNQIDEIYNHTKEQICLIINEDVV